MWENLTCWEGAESNLPTASSSDSAGPGSDQQLMVIEGDRVGLLILSERVKFWISETFLCFQKIIKTVGKEYKGLDRVAF